MKTTITLATTILLTLCILASANAQKKDCIICPEMLGIITSSENGVNISTLTPNQNTSIIVSSERQKSEKATKTKSSKKANRQKIKEETNNKLQEIDNDDDEIIGFADVGLSEASNEENLEDCGCDGSSTNIEEEKEEIELFTLYPNPAHHWVVINSKLANDSSCRYKLFLKDSQGQIIKEREVSGASTKLDLRSLKEGVYFVTLRNEKDFSTTVKKVTIK